MFIAGKDEYIRKGTKGYIVTYGDMLYRSLDAVERLRKEGIDVGLINKATLNVVDEAAMKEIGSTGFVLVVESLNQRTALGSKASHRINWGFGLADMSCSSELGSLSATSIRDTVTCKRVLRTVKHIDALL